MKQRLYNRIEPFDPDRVEHGAYELGLGKHVFTTDKRTSEIICPNQKVVIKPGQMAMLLTEEEISIPNDIVGFISIKAGIKFRGLINISGFHVDPGFRGHLKFSTYNAGVDPIHIQRCDPIFLIWFGLLDKHTQDTYNGNYGESASISSEDVMMIQGDIPSPNKLNERIDSLERKVEILIALAVVIIGSVISILVS